MHNSFGGIDIEKGCRNHNFKLQIEPPQRKFGPRSTLALEYFFLGIALEYLGHVWLHVTNCHVIVMAATSTEAVIRFVPNFPHAIEKSVYPCNNSRHSYDVIFA